MLIPHLNPVSSLRMSGVTPRIRLHGVDRDRMQLKVVMVSLEAVSLLLTGVAVENHTEPQTS